MSTKNPTDQRRTAWFVGLGVLALILAASIWLLRDHIQSKSQPPVTHASDAEAQQLKSTALRMLGNEQLDEAEPLLARWGDLRPDDAEPYRLRMYLWHRKAYQGTSDAERQRLQTIALDYGLQALKRSPDDDAAAQEVVFLSLAVGRFDDADRIVRRCHERQPLDPSVLHLLARVCHARGESSEAAELLDTLLTKQPRHARGMYLRAILHYEAGEADEAVKLLRQVIAQDRNLELEARYHLSLALAQLGKSEEARQAFTEVQRQNLEQAATRAGHAALPAVQVRRAELLFAAGNDSEALALVQTVLADEPKYSAAHRLAAAYYQKHGDQKKADEHRRRAEGQSDE